jgi:hypothetical protein
MNRRRLTIAIAAGGLTLSGLTAAVVPALAATGPTPAVSSIVVPRIVSAQQGHARFLVGVRVSMTARLVVRITRVSNHRLMKTVTTSGYRRAGRAFLLIQATDNQGYQLPAGAYTVFIGATSPGGRNAAAHVVPLTLTYTSPRGMLDWYTIPNTTFVRANLGLHMTGGQVVVAVNPGSALANAGIVRGDVIEAINGVSTGSPGGFQRATRLLPAGAPVPVVLLRGVTTRTTSFTAPPDWLALSNLASPMAQAAATKRFAYGYAVATYDISVGKLLQAGRIIGTWKGANSTTSLAQMARAQLAVAQHRQSAALAFWIRAYRADNAQSLAAFGEGLAYDALGNDMSAAEAFAVAASRDPGSSEAPAYAALALEQSHLPYLAAPFAQRAVAIDATDPNALAATGIAEIQTGQRAAGVSTLERGIVETDDATRAQLLMSRFLEPAVP